jgi:hypothetical protein
MATYVERVAVVGPSHTLGIGTPDKRGWIQMLHEHYDALNGDVEPGARHPRIFYELGAYAMQAKHLETIIKPEIDLRFCLPNENGDYDPTKRLAIVMIGGNESWVQTKTGNSLVAPAEFRQRVANIAGKLAGRGQVLYVGTLPPDEKKCSDFWNTDTPPQLASRIEFENIGIEEFTAIGARIVPLAANAAASRDFMASIAKDGTHVGAVGELWIYDQVRPTFDEMVR